MIIKVQNNYLTSNYKRIANLRWPDSIRRTSSSRMSLHRLFEPPKYFVDNKEAYRLQVSTEKYTQLNVTRKTWDGLCYWVYSTNGSLTPLFRDKSVQYVLRSLRQNREVCDRVFTVVSLILYSYDFECILTDISELAESGLGRPVICDDVNIIKYDSDVDGKDRVLRNLLQTHKSIPLRLMNEDILRRVSLESSNWDRSKLNGATRVLILVASNMAYASYLYRNLQLEGALPVSLFNVTSRAPLV